MDYEHPGLCLVVLATGCRRPARTRVAGRTYRRSIPFSTDDSRSASQARDGRAMLESRFCGLPFSRLQYQHRIFTNGLSRIIGMGQAPYDGSIAHFPDDGGSVGSSRSKYSLAAWVTIQAAETTSLKERVGTNASVRPKAMMRSKTKTGGSARISAKRESPGVTVWHRGTQGCRGKQ